MDSEFVREMQTLQEVRAFISEDEYERRKAEILARAGPSVSEITTEVGKITIAKDTHTEQPSSADEEDLKKIIVVYMLDGSRKYTPMVITSLKTLQEQSPNLNIGFLVLPAADVNLVTQELRDTSRIHTRKVSNHFISWNPTQFKLDIEQFADEFETIVWIDSDTIIMKDIRPWLLNFHRSSKSFTFVKDRVNFSEDFRARWENQEFMFIPQSCLMGFKAKSMHFLMESWKNWFRDWIEPAPFHNHADPYPSFPGSQFCIEQYALGMAVADNLGKHFSELVQVIPRQDILINTKLHLAISVIVSQILAGNTQIGIEGNIDWQSLIRQSEGQHGTTASSALAFGLSSTSALSSGFSFTLSSAGIASSAIVASSALLGGYASGGSSFVGSSALSVGGSDVVVVDSLADGLILHYYSANYEKLRIY